MGTSRARDRFVVITDGQELMHLVLFWRDAIPADWKPIGPGKDRRIACEVPVRFGDQTVTTPTSEPSVLTSGYRSIIVNNRLRNESAFSALPPFQRVLAAALADGDPVNAPYGIKRIDWDPKTRTCRAVRANREISIPNAIPTLSTESGLVYGQGQRAGVWRPRGPRPRDRRVAAVGPAPAAPDPQLALRRDHRRTWRLDLAGCRRRGRHLPRTGPRRTGASLLRSRATDRPRERARAHRPGRRARHGLRRGRSRIAGHRGGRRAAVARVGRFRIRVPGTRPRRVAVSVTDAAGLRSTPKRVRVGTTARRPPAAPRPRS